MPKRVLIDTNIYAADEMGYPDAVEFIEQLIEDETEIIITTLIEMEIMSHFEIETDPSIRKNREGYIHNATLVSNNDKDFNWIRDNYTYKGRKLDYVNPIYR